MNRLLRAGFRRLLKNRLYHVGLLFSAGLSVFASVSRYVDIRKYPDVYALLGPEYKSVEGFVFALATMTVFAMAVVTNMFLGTEYSDGTMRNKIIVGHKRFCIYITNYLVCAAANLSMLLIGYLAAFGVGGLLLTDSYLSAGEILLNCLCECTVILGLTAIFVLIAMLVQSKAGASVTALLTIVLLFVLAMSISNSLLQPEYEEYAKKGVFDSETGIVEIEPIMEKNPKYLTGTKRVIFEQLDMILPLNQIMRISDGRASEHWGVMEGYLALTVIVLGGFGIAVFRKKDLK